MITFKAVLRSPSYGTTVFLTFKSYNWKSAFDHVLSWIDEHRFDSYYSSDLDLIALSIYEPF